MRCHELCGLESLSYQCTVLSWKISSADQLTDGNPTSVCLGWAGDFLGISSKSYRWQLGGQGH